MAALPCDEPRQHVGTSMAQLPDGRSAVLQEGERQGAFLHVVPLE